MRCCWAIIQRSKNGSGRKSGLWFLRLPTHAELDTVFLEQDRLLVVLPEGHPLAEYRKIPVSALCEEPFMLLEKGAKAEVSEIFERSHLTPKVHFTTWDDYAIMAMVEGGLGISVCRN